MARAKRYQRGIRVCCGLTRVLFVDDDAAFAGDKGRVDDVDRRGRCGDGGCETLDKGCEEGFSVCERGDFAFVD